MILSGCDGAVSIAFVEVLKCTRWSGTLSRRFVERTSRGFMDRDYIPGKRVFAGEIIALATVENTGLTEIEDHFNEDFPTPVTVTLWIDKARSKGLSFSAYLESTSAGSDVGKAGQKSYTITSTGSITSTL